MLALDDEHREALVGHFDSAAVSELVRRESPPNAGEHCGGVASGGLLPAPADSNAVDQRSVSARASASPIRSPARDRITLSALWRAPSGPAPAARMTATISSTVGGSARIAQALVTRPGGPRGSPASSRATGDGQPRCERQIPSCPPLGGDRTRRSSPDSTFALAAPQPAIERHQPPGGDKEGTRSGSGEAPWFRVGAVPGGSVRSLCVNARAVRRLSGRGSDEIEEFFLGAFELGGLDRFGDRLLRLDAGRPEDLEEVAFGVVEVEAQ